jgi:hypothetical protein
VREKNVVIASNIGDAPLSIENDPVTKNDIRNTTIPATSHTTRLMRRMRANPTRSILGGQRSSSIERLASSNCVAVDIVIDDKESTYRYKYIRKIQNSKIFHCDEVHNISDEYPLIGMRDSSGEYESVSYIEKSRFFRIFFSDIVIDESEDEDDRDELERESCDRYREGYP